MSPDFADGPLASGARGPRVHEWSHGAPREETGSADDTRADDKWWGMAAHGSALLSFALPLANLVGPLAIAVGRYESRFVAEEARAALNFQLTVLLLYGASLPFFLILLTWWVGLIVWWMLGVMNVVFALVAILRSTSGAGYRYPFTLEPVKAHHLRALADRMHG